MVKPRQHQPLQHDAEDAHDQRREDQRRPVTDARIVQQHPRNKRPHHVLGAVREIDDVEQPEDHGKSQAEKRIERAVDQPEQQLPEERLWRDADEVKHVPEPEVPGRGMAPPRL